jgi:hypothetical protein
MNHSKFMKQNFLKIALLAAATTVASSICVSAAVLPGMDGAGGVQPALVGPVSNVSPASAPSPTYSDLDAILGFRVLAGTGSGFEGMIDLGAVSQFTANTSFTLSLGSVGAFMSNSSNFGSDWYTRSTSGQVGKTDIQWGVVATDNQTNLTNDLWSSRNPAVRSTPWNSSFDQSTPSNFIQGVGTYFNGGGSVAAGTVSAKKLSSSNANSWTNNQPGGGHGTISFGFFNPTNEGNTSTVLAFDQIPQGSTNPGTKLGTFTWNSDGTVVWNGATAVPEPSTYAMMGLGTLGLVGLMILRRRRAARA